MTLKNIYTAPTAEAADKALDNFKNIWSSKYPTIAPSWESNWERHIPFLEYGPEIRRVIYTTNTIESLNISLRKILKNRAFFPNDDAALKLIIFRTGANL